MQARWSPRCQGRECLIKFLENADKQSGETGATSAGALEGKGQAVINLAEGSEQTESGLVFKRGFKEHEDDGAVASKRRVEVVMETSVGTTNFSDDLFHQLLEIRVSQSSGSKSVWSPSFLLDQAPGEIFQSESDTEMYKRLTRSQMAKVSLRLASIMNFSVLDASFSESRLSNLEMENLRLQKEG